MRNNIAANRLLRIRIKHGAGPAINLRNDLIGDDDRDAELVRETLEGAHEFGEVGLAGGELAAAGEVGAVKRGGRVDDEEAEARLAHHVGGLVQELELVVRVVGAGVGDVVEDLFAREAVAVRDGEEPHGAEGAFRVDVEAFALAAAHVEGELAGYGEGVADLGFPCAEFAEDFRDGAGFDAAGEEGVELFGARGDGDELGATLVHFGGGGEAHGHDFGGCGAGNEFGGVHGCMESRSGVDGPSASILVAFCSEMPLTCSSTLRGLYISQP